MNLFQLLVSFGITCFHVYFFGRLSSDFQTRVLDLKEVKDCWLRVFELFQCIISIVLLYGIFFSLQACGYVKYVDLGKKEENFYRRRQHR